MQKVFKSLIILVIIISVYTPVLAITNNNAIYNPTTISKEDYYSNVNLDKKVYDYADIYTAEEEENLEKRVNKIIKKYDTELVILTSDHNGSYNTRSIAIDFYDGNNFGADEEGTGTILVIDMNARNYYILTTGLNLKIINDYRVEKILDKMETNMVSGNYYDATQSFLSEVNKYESYHKYGPPFLWIGAIILAAILAFSSLLKERKKLKLVKDSMDASNYFIDNVVDYQDDVLIDTKVHSYHHSSSSSSGRSGGGFSGGSGGGRSHGGGGRRF